MGLHRAEVRTASLLFAVVLLYSAVVWLALEPLGASPLPSYHDYARIILTSWMMAVLLLSVHYLFRLALYRRPQRPLATFLADVSEQFRPGRLVSRLAPAILLTLLLGSFTAFKSIVPVLNPFQYDQLLMELDRLIFFGIDPWRITHALFGSSLATWILQQFYIYWFVLMWLSLAFVMIRTDLRRLRNQYLLAYSLSFILLGSVAALALSSAGPCYYGWVGDGPDVYAPLMERLREQNAELAAMSPPQGLGGLLLQEYLKQAHDQGEIVFGGGISAMPSMHVAVAALLALAGHAYKRWIGRLLSPVVIVIWIGSIHLGWHYAVDGIVALILTIAIWRFSGWVVGDFGHTDDEPALPRALPQAPTVAQE